MTSPTPAWTLQRSAGDAKLAGVCGGLAERWDVDPVIVRVGCVLLALTGGIGVVLYLAGWLLLPVATTGRAVVDDLVGGALARWPRELWVASIVLACVGSFTLFVGVSPFGLAPALVLAAVWFFGRSRHRHGSQQPMPPAAPTATSALPPVTWSGQPTPFTTAAAAWQARVVEVRTGVPATPYATSVGPATDPAPVPVPVEPPAAPTTWTQPPYVEERTPELDEDAARAAFLAQPDPVGLYAEPEPAPLVRPGATRSARRLRLGTLAALGLTGAGLGIADATGTHVPLVVYAATALLVVSLGLVAATWWGRARGMLPAAVVLAVLTVVASGAFGPVLSGPTRAAGGLVEHDVAYVSAAAFPAGGDHADVGALDVDLSRLQLTGDATYAASVDAGNLVVTTPPGTGVTLHFAVDTGRVDAYGHLVAAGSDIDGDQVLVPAASGQHTLTLDLSVDAGTVEVRS